MTTRPSDSRRLSNFQIGLIALVLTVIGFYLAFTKSIPFKSDGYTLKAVFSDAQSIRQKSPVRIAGVDVGEVTQVENLGDQDGDGRAEDAALVTMTIEDAARPVKEDATMQLRPRLFLEGNLFVDLQPGSPGAEELDSGSVIPLEQTAISVQFDQVLTSLQAPVREQLQIFLKEFGVALCGENPPIGRCEPGSGGEGFREFFRTSPAANRYTAEVNEALLGTQPGDLSGFIRNLDTFVRALNNRQPQLQDLITNLRIVTGSFAAESEALELAIVELPDLLAEGRPALAKLNDALPQLRAFAREALPGTKAANRALDQANPWIGQLRKLVSKKELRGLVKDLRPTIPSLARLAKESLPFLEESRALSSCFANVVIPWGDTEVPANETAPTDRQPVYKLTAYSLVGVSGESRSGDAQGQWFRVLGSGGPNTFAVQSPDADIGALGGLSTFPFTGVQPALESSQKTPFRPDQPCENQALPNLASSVVTPPAANPVAARSTGSVAPVGGQQTFEVMEKILEAQSLEQQGQQQEAQEVREEILDELPDLGLNPKDLPQLEQQLGELVGPGVGFGTSGLGLGN